MMESRHFDKQLPPEGMLFWRFLGSSNIIVAGNASWRERAKPIRNALARSVGTYIPQFGAASQKLVGILGDADSEERNSSAGVSRLLERLCAPIFARCDWHDGTRTCLRCSRGSKLHIRCAVPLKGQTKCYASRQQLKSRISFLWIKQ